MKKNIDVYRVGARTFTITWDRETMDEMIDNCPKATEDGIEPYAAVSRALRKIAINPDMNKTGEAVLEALIHEGTHGGEAFVGRKVPEELIGAIVAIVVNSMIQTGLLDPNEFVIAGVDLETL